MDPQPARPTVRSYRQQRQMQATGAEEAGARRPPRRRVHQVRMPQHLLVPLAEIGEAHWPFKETRFDLVAGYGSRRNQSGTAPAAGQEMGMGIRNQYRQPRS